MTHDSPSNTFLATEPADALAVPQSPGRGIILLRSLHDYLERLGTPPTMLFLSASDTRSQAVTRHASAASFEETWEKAVSALGQAVSVEDTSFLRVDWVVRRDQIVWQAVRRRRRGSLELTEDMAFLDWELAANGILYTQAGFSLLRADSYAKKRFGRNFPELHDDSLVVLLGTQGVYIDGRDGEPGPAPVRDTWNGFRSCEGPSEELVTAMREAIQPRLTTLTMQSESSLFLTLGIYALAAAGLKNEMLTALKRCRLLYRDVPGGQAAFPLDGQEIKIGASGILLAALCLSDTDQNLRKALALGIRHMYPNHVYDAKTFAVRESFRILAYDFEAAYGLLLHARTGDDRDAYELGKNLLFSGLEKENAADNFWSAFCIARLSEQDPGNTRFLKTAIRCLPRPYQVLDKKEANPKDCLRMAALLSVFRTHDVTTRLDSNAYAAAYECLTARLACGVLWPEVAVFFPNPGNMLTGFALRESGFRMRLDIEQEALCALLAYAGYSRAGSLVHSRKRECPSPKPASIEACKKALEERRTVLLFLWLDIPLVASGLELAAMRRAELFSTFFGHHARILVTRYQANAHELAAMHCRLGHLSREQVVSMYDFFQEIDRSQAPREIELPPVDPSWVRADVPNSKDYRLWENNFCVQYVGFDRMTGRLAYIGHYDHTVKVRHDSFDELGFLGRTEILDPQSGLTTDALYYRPDGTLALIEKYAITRQNNRYSSHLVRMDWVWRVDVRVSPHTPHGTVGALLRL